MTDRENIEAMVNGMGSPEEKIKFLIYLASQNGQDKDDIHERLAKIERAFNMGAGILLILPMIGSAVALCIAFGQKLFKPWMGP